MSKAPNFIILGAMKCATSTLHDQLEKQDGLFLSTPKEPNFFSNDEIYKLGTNWYEDLFSEANSADICGESSTHYTKLPTYPDTIPRIQKHLSDVKFIYVIRHPIDRLVSQYIHEWSENIIKCDINAALDEHPELIQYSLYHKQIAPYYEAFGPDSILIINFHRLIKQPQQSLEETCRHIGYPHTPIWINEEAPKNVSSERIRKFPLYDLLVESKLSTSLRRKVIPQNFRNYIKGKFTLSDRPKLSHANLARLEKTFDKDLEKLKQLVGYSLTCDNFKSIE